MSQKWVENGKNVTRMDGKWEKGYKNGWKMGKMSQEWVENGKIHHKNEWEMEKMVLVCIYRYQHLGACTGFMATK